MGIVEEQYEEFTKIYMKRTKKELVEILWEIIMTMGEGANGIFV